MIVQADRDLIQWAISAIGARVAPLLTAPTDSGDPSASLYLLDLVDDPSRRDSSTPPYQPVLRYLVTIYHPDPEEAHRLLSDLLFSAMGHPVYEVELNPLPGDLWAAFRIAPRPAFILRAPLMYARQEVPVKLVREPEPSLDGSAPIKPLYGLLLGPGDIPLMNARIELPNLYISATTDHQGRFILAGVPAEPKKKTLLIKARRQEKIEVVEKNGTPDEPVIIRFHLFKEGGK